MFLRTVCCGYKMHHGVIAPVEVLHGQALDRDQVGPHVGRQLCRWWWGFAEANSRFSSRVVQEGRRPATQTEGQSSSLRKGLTKELT